jgi:hypothetical protein
VSRLVPSLCLVVLTGCIERAQQPHNERQEFDRTGIRDLIVPSIPPNAHPVGAKFGNAGDQVELAAVAFDPPAAGPGASVKVTFFYRVLDNEPGENWKAFVHIEDGRGGRINGDHWPTGQGSLSAAGRYPMSVWRRGEIIRDEWSFSVPSYSDVEKLDFWTGLYNPYRDDRLPLTNASQVANDGQNRVMAGSLGLRG